MQASTSAALNAAVQRSKARAALPRLALVACGALLVSLRLYSSYAYGAQVADSDAAVRVAVSVVLTGVAGALFLRALAAYRSRGLALRHMDPRQRKLLGLGKDSSSESNLPAPRTGSASGVPSSSSGAVPGAPQPALMRPILPTPLALAARRGRLQDSAVPSPQQRLVTSFGEGPRSPFDTDSPSALSSRRRDAVLQRTNKAKGDAASGTRAAGGVAPLPGGPSSATSVISSAGPGKVQQLASAPSSFGVLGRGFEQEQQQQQPPQLQPPSRLPGPLQSTTTPQSGSTQATASNDEAAFQLLHSLPVDWLEPSTASGSRLSCAVFMDSWYVKLRAKLASHIRDNVLASFDRNAAQLEALVDPASGQRFFPRALLQYETADENSMAPLAGSPMAAGGSAYGCVCSRADAVFAQAAMRARQAILATMPSQQALSSTFASFSMSRGGNMGIDPKAQAANVQSQVALLDKLVADRLALEKYLKVQRTSHSKPFDRAFVLKRLRVLGDSLPKVGNLRDQHGTHHLPTDTEIVMRVAYVMLDSALRQDSTQPDFEEFHVRDAQSATEVQLASEGFWGIFNAGCYSTETPGADGGSGAPSAHLLSPWDMSAVSPHHHHHHNHHGYHSSDVLALQVAPGTPVFHPHYKVLVRGEEWQVQSGRQNCFAALILFMYSIKVAMPGLASKIELVNAVFDSSSSLSSSSSSSGRGSSASRGNGIGGGLAHDGGGFF